MASMGIVPRDLNNCNNLVGYIGITILIFIKICRGNPSTIQFKLLHGIAESVCNSLQQHGVVCSSSTVAETSLESIPRYAGFMLYNSVLMGCLIYLSETLPYCPY